MDVEPPDMTAHRLSGPSAESTINQPVFLTQNRLKQRLSQAAQIQVRVLHFLKSHFKTVANVCTNVKVIIFFIQKNIQSGL